MKELRLVINAVNKSNYLNHIEHFLQTLRDKNEDNYADYFEKYYLEREDQWAAWGRIKAPYTTSMAAEAWHRRLKGNELKGKKTQRADLLVEILIRYPAKYAANLFAQEAKCSTVTRRQEATNRHHLKAIHDYGNSVIQVQNGIYAEVESSKKNGSLYRVSKFTECSCDVSIFIY